MAIFSPLVPLSDSHDTSSFECSDREIDRFLREQAHAEQQLRLSQVYVTAGPEGEVLAFFTLSPLAICIDELLLERMGLGSIPYRTIGGFLLGRLGVHRSIQQQGIGEALVMRAAQIARREAEVIGGVFLAVDPKSDALVSWYTDLDFIRLSKGTRRLVLPLSSVH